MENRDHRGRFTNLRRKIISFLKTAAFILVAIVYVPVSAMWATQQLVAHVRGAEIAHYVAPVALDRKEAKRRELEPQYRQALEIAVEKAIAQEDKDAAESQLEELRKRELEHPLP